jgi:hypothetical protein
VGPNTSGAIFRPGSMMSIPERDFSGRALADSPEPRPPRRRRTGTDSSRRPTQRRGGYLRESVPSRAIFKVESAGAPLRTQRNRWTQRSLLRGVCIHGGVDRHRASPGVTRALSWHWQVSTIGRRSNRRRRIASFRFGSDYLLRCGHGQGSGGRRARLVAGDVRDAREDQADRRDELYLSSAI